MPDTMTATHAIQPIIIIKESAYIVKGFIWKYEQKPLVITELPRNTNLFQAQTENHIFYDDFLYILINRLIKINYRITSSASLKKRMKRKIRRDNKPPASTA
jgi:hypothetical protein